MTVEKLQEILNSKEPLTVAEVQNIIYELKNDVVGKSDLTNKYECGFYNGEMNAFYICLDLLEKVKQEKSKKEDKPPTPRFKVGDTVWAIGWYWSVAYLEKRPLATAHEVDRIVRHEDEIRYYVAYSEFFVESELYATMDECLEAIKKVQGERK